MMNNFIFFGSDDFSIEVLKVLLDNNIRPRFVITQPDKPKGRNLVLTSPEIKTFCIENNIKVLQFEKLSLSVFPLQTGIQAFNYFVVASYGKIIPKEILEIPKFGVLNVHPSLLPKYRGASPIETAILNDDKNTGVTIMLMDEKMDHGAIISQEIINFSHWPNKEIVRKDLAKVGGQMLVDIIPKFLNKTMTNTPQDHDRATFTKLIKKEDGEIHETDFEFKKYLKYLAYTPWPGTFFFVSKGDKKLRIKITEAIYENEKFLIKKVIPEGKPEMTFESFKNGYLI